MVKMFWIFLRWRTAICFRGPIQLWIAKTLSHISNLTTLNSQLRQMIIVLSWIGHSLSIWLGKKYKYQELEYQNIYIYIYSAVWLHTLFYWIYSDTSKRNWRQEKIEQNFLFIHSLTVLSISRLNVSLGYSKCHQKYPCRTLPMMSSTNHSLWCFEPMISRNFKTPLHEDAKILLKPECL